MYNEPDMVINGKQLTEAQAMTVRVALQSFALDCYELPKKFPEGNNAIFPLYLERIKEINEIICGK